MIKCESCGWENPLHAAFCTNCGSELDRAEASISTDMSGSDELSLDGSERNLIVEAAKKNSPMDPEGSSVAESDAKPTVEMAAFSSSSVVFENRATLQLKQPSGPGALADSTATQAEPNKAGPLNVSSEPTDLSPGEIGKRSSETDEEGGDTTAAPILLRAKSNLASTVAMEAAPDSSSDGDENQNSDFAYVAFDDGVDGEEVDDLSLQSLDVGVESLSMDDSLYIGADEDNEAVQSETIAPVGSSSLPASVEGTNLSRSFRLRVTSNSGEGSRIEVPKEGLEVGRSKEPFNLDDQFVSPKHFRIAQVENGLSVTDLESRNGTWIRLQDGADMEDGDEIRMGRQRFSLGRRVGEKEADLRGADGTLLWTSLNSESEWELRGSNNLCLAIPSSGLRIGRLSGTLLFEDDDLLSSVHAIVFPTKTGIKIRDFNSESGSWKRIRRETQIAEGGELLIGETRLMVEEVE